LDHLIDHQIPPWHWNGEKQKMVVIRPNRLFVSRICRMTLISACNQQWGLTEYFKFKNSECTLQ
jgi:hypothetical protein